MSQRRSRATAAISLSSRSSPPSAGLLPTTRSATSPRGASAVRCGRSSAGSGAPLQPPRSPRTRRRRRPPPGRGLSTPVSRHAGRAGPCRPTHRRRRGPTRTPPRRRPPASCGGRATARPAVAITRGGLKARTSTPASASRCQKAARRRAARRPASRRAPAPARPASAVDRARRRSDPPVGVVVDDVALEVYEGGRRRDARPATPGSSRRRPSGGGPRCRRRAAPRPLATVRDPPPGAGPNVRPGGHCRDRRARCQAANQGAAGCCCVRQ